VTRYYRSFCIKLWVALQCPFGWSSRLASPFGACSRSTLRASPRCEYPGLKNPFRSMLSGFGTIWTDFGKKSNFEIFDFFLSPRFSKIFSQKNENAQNGLNHPEKWFPAVSGKMHILHIPCILCIFWIFWNFTGTRQDHTFHLPPRSSLQVLWFALTKSTHHTHTLTPHTHISQIYCVDNI